MDSNDDWRRWGRIDPLWAVATWRDRQAGGRTPWTDEDFYATGAADWAGYLARWEQHGLDRESCVEIGCGAGRLTRHLARSFGRVWALDVSEAMLAYARARIDAGNVEFLEVSGDAIPLPDRCATAAFSTFVFQHFESTAMATRYFREIARVLKPGGSMLVHLPIHQWPRDSVLYEMAHRLGTSLQELRIWGRRALVPLGARPPMRTRSYPQAYVFETLRGLGLGHLEVATIPGGGAPHQLVFAVKDERPAAGAS